MAMIPVSLNPEQSLRIDVVKLLVDRENTPANQHSVELLLSRADKIVQYVINGSTSKPTQQFKESVKQVVIECLDSPIDPLTKALKKQSVAL